MKTQIAGPYPQSLQFSQFWVGICTLTKFSDDTNIAGQVTAF